MSNERANIIGIDYISVRVKDFATALRCLCELLEVDEADAIVMRNLEAGGEREDCALLRVGDCHLEIISPRDPSSRLGRILEKSGEGLHHINLVTDDLDREISRLTEKGYRFAFEEPLEDMFGCRYTFLHPKSTHGVLVGIGAQWERDGKDKIRPVKKL